MIQWIFYPRSDEPTDLAKKVAGIFEIHASEVDSSINTRQESDKVLAKLASDLKTHGFEVESGKKRGQRIRVPVLFGMAGKPEKSFDADAYNKEQRFVLEIEAGRAFTNYQFLKDLFEACMMHDVDYLAIAVRNIYIKHRDFDSVNTFFDTLYSSSRLELPLKGVMIIGY